MSSRPRRIVLVGFMAAGKSTVGRLLADRLGVGFVDLDARIERAAGKSVREIFADEGESGFREREARATRELASEAGKSEPLVIAVGGGWMARPALRDRWPDAVRVWLRVSPEGVLRRVGDDPSSRPLLSDAESPDRAIRQLMRRREAAYARAEYDVETDGRTPVEVADHVFRLLASAPAGASTASEVD